MTAAEVGQLAIAWRRADCAAMRAEDELPGVPDNNPAALKAWKKLSRAASAAWDAFDAAVVEACEEQGDLLDELAETGVKT